jgi:hypothetical protein
MKASKIRKQDKRGEEEENGIRRWKEKSRK